MIWLSLATNNADADENKEEEKAAEGGVVATHNIRHLPLITKAAFCAFAERVSVGVVEADVAEDLFGMICGYEEDEDKAVQPMRRRYFAHALVRLAFQIAVANVGFGCSLEQVLQE